MKISGWGKYPIAEATILQPQSSTEAKRIILSGQACLIPRGRGRSYGDSANASLVLQTKYLDHYIDFNAETGVLSCEAGVSLSEILDLIIPHGWMLPVTPGTSFVTIGGAIASDVHGKNHHHAGTFSNHLRSIDILLGSGQLVTSSPTLHPDLFRATCGGMGLTGLIISATIQLTSIKSSWINQKTLKASCIESLCDLFEQHHQDTYSVAWIDCMASGSALGRSLLMLGEHATEGGLAFKERIAFSVPMEPPFNVLNSFSIKIFNELYYRKSKATSGNTLLPFKNYFYPLDSLKNWNNLYGKTGFVQYQFVLPKSVGVKGLKKVLKVISDSGEASFLAVLKVFGPENTNYLSFPQEGYSLALDFKLSQKVVELIKTLDGLIIAMGGRIYLTKDALMSEKTFKLSYVNWDIFESVREKYGAIGKFSSNQSTRLGLQ